MSKIGLHIASQENKAHVGWGHGENQAWYPAAGVKTGGVEEKLDELSTSACLKVFKQWSFFKSSNKFLPKLQRA